MKIAILPLRERLKKLKSGYPAHAEFVPCAIWAFSNLPMSTYLGGFDMEMTALADSLGIPQDELGDYTYKEVACFLMELKDSAEYGELYPDAVIYFTAPLRNFWRKRSELLAKS